ncbi:LacI family DNA-binding transcriptional regulator [Nonomuraea dietziae]|uniref:LacI family DNA-binding transcriptional regulator n=1 Tax=Nonomuraea dietziae TaxID=65515 RepID=UPI0031DF6D34
MADVAKEAGVSHQTVSRVLNDHPNVRGETRARVLAPSASSATAATSSPAPGHQALEDARCGQLRHHPVRPRQHGLRHRTGRQIGRILRQHRQPQSIDRRGVLDALDYLADQVWTESSWSRPSARPPRR